MPHHALRDFYDHTAFMQFFVDATGKRTTSRAGMIVVWRGRSAANATQRLPTFRTPHNAPKSSKAFGNHIPERRDPSIQNHLVAWLDLGKGDSGTAVLAAIGHLPEGLEDFPLMDDLNSDAGPRGCREPWNNRAAERAQVRGPLGG